MTSATSSVLPPRGSVRLRRLLSWSTSGLGLLLVIGYFLVASTNGQNIIYVCIGAVSTLVMIVGIKLNRPVEAWGWWFLVLGNAASTIGDGIENILYGMVLNKSVPFPSIADLFYLAAYPFLFLGLARICRTREQDASRESYADATVVALAAAAISWNFVMGYYVHHSDLDLFGKLVILAYPFMDLGLLFILLRSIIFGSSRLTVHRILAAAFTFTLIADSVYDYLVQRGAYATGNIIDAGWLFNYTLMAVAAMHPSAAGLSPVRAADPSARRRLPVLTVAAFVAPVILLVGSLDGDHVDTPVIAGTSIVLLCLLSLRMSWLFQGIRSHGLRAEANAAALADALDTRERLESDLRHQAFHDSLTGLANRALLFDRTSEALLAARARGGIVALCVIDLDGFKTINDSLGHESGDALLAEMAARLLSMVRGSDTVARLGGDEFAVLLSGIDSPGTAIEIANRIVVALREPVNIADRQIAVSASVGVTFAGPSKSTEQLLSEADVAMYEAKAKGKSRCETFESSMHTRTIERLELANALRGSLERNEFRLLYQPIFCLADGRLQGFESLVRWHHPTRGVVGPDKFIPLAEETGFIIPLGRWVLETACEQAAQWEADQSGDLTMAVNVSGRQLQDKSFRNDIRTALALTCLRPENLILEVTESSLLADSEETTQALNDLKRVGVQLALDDFGTGYSSLSYLRRLPLDMLKIDKSFVDPLAEGRAQEQALVATIIDFARILGLRTAAEGVEDERQRAILTQLGCTSAQGFLLGRPLDGIGATRLIGRRQATLR